MSLPNASKSWAASRFPLSRVTTFRIGGPAELAAKPRSPADAADLVRWARGEGLPIRCVGMGSNLLVDDSGVRGLVLLLRGMDALWFEGPRVTAGAGVTNARILSEARARGLGGLQCLVGYPGTLGGAVRMNAGGAPGYVGALVERVRGVDAAGRIVERPGAECGFRYRGSDLADLVVTEVDLLLPEADAEEFALECHAIYRRKMDTQPLELPSAGCVWKNPPGAVAGRLVDMAGCKGLREGDAEVSERHANFIVNRGAATAADVRRLMAEVRRRVLDRFGVLLDPEVIEWSDGESGGIGR
ncbi:MAG TPA: UDP-N-acetylmuramate dehydrogenase [Planctomycetota bacterium]|nr:UDP-N-acetylmuramate dehydrogenase [Planctomycetota bacterium]